MKPEREDESTLHGKLHNGEMNGISEKSVLEPVLLPIRRFDKPLGERQASKSLFVSFCIAVVFAGLAIMLGLLDWRQAGAFLLGSATGHLMGMIECSVQVQQAALEDRMPLSSPLGIMFGVHASTVQYWRHKVADSRRPEAAPAKSSSNFLPVVVRPVAAMESVVVRLPGDVSISVPCDATSALVTVLNQLRYQAG